MSIRPDQESGLQWRDLMRGLNALPVEQRTVILLVSVEDLSYAEAASVLGIPVGTVMSRLARGRERLRQLTEEGRGSPGAAEGQMSDPGRPIAEEELHAWIDDQLERGRQAAVLRYLQEQPEVAQQVAAWREQREALRAVLRPAWPPSRSRRGSDWSGWSSSAWAAADALAGGGTSCWRSAWAARAAGSCMAASRRPPRSR